MNDPETMAVINGIGRFEPCGESSLVDAVDLVSNAIAHCRKHGIDRLLVDVTGLSGVPVPSLVERFLMAEDWAHESKGKVTVAMVASSEHIHPQKFAVKVAERLGLVCDVYTSVPDALNWLADGSARAG